MSGAAFLLIAATSTSPAIQIDAFIDSAERQTLPRYEIDCSLVDERSDNHKVTLRQTGGRGVKGTPEELETLPVWRKFVRTPVRVDVLNDQARLFDASAIQVMAHEDALRWDKNLNGYSRSPASLREQNGTIIEMQILGHTSNGNKRTRPSRVAVALSRSTVRDGRPEVKLVGFCSVIAAPQLPLSSGEESEFRKK